MKIMIRKYKILAFSAFLAILVLSTFNATFSVAAVSQQGTCASIQLNKDNPRAYGVIVPPPNMYVTTRLQGSYQANLDIIDWNGGTPDYTINTENYPGNNISWGGPWYSEGKEFFTPTLNGYTDPGDIRWFNLTALEAKNDTLADPFEFNMVWNSYSFTEGGSLLIPINYSIPIEVDITINSLGPKLLKVDWLTNNPDGNYLGTWRIISPSGHVLSENVHISRIDVEISTASEEQYDVLQFISHETGTYKLLMLTSTNTVPMQLLLEFINPTIKTLSLSTNSYGGPGDADPTYYERLDNAFFAEWWRISAIKGDKFVLDYNPVYWEDTNDHVVNIWYPCSTGYRTEASVNAGYGRFDIIAPITGDIYVSCISRDYWSNYRNRLYCEKIEANTLTLNTTEAIHISRGERKVFDFTLEEESFLRVNKTVIGTAGTMMYGWDGSSTSWSSNRFSFLDTKKGYCVQPISSIETKIANYTYDYYYLPNGSYEILVRNTDIKKDGVFMITTSFVEYANLTIVPEVLSYPSDDPSIGGFTKLTFKADDYEKSLKKAQWVEINITEASNWLLNGTIWRSDNLGAFQPYVNPSKVIVFNDSDNSFTDWTGEALDPNKYFPAFSDDGGDETGDRLLIAYPQKWHDLEFNFTTFQSGGSWVIETWTAGGWDQLTTPADYTDNTGGFTSNDTIDLVLTSEEYEDWIMGAQFNIPGVEKRLYYWLSIRVDSDITTVPEINHLRISNTTLSGELNWIWVRDSPYQYCDYVQSSTDTLYFINVLSLLDGYENDSDSTSLWAFQGEESGVLKLLLVPEHWSYSGDVVIGINAYSFDGYNRGGVYNITSNPLVYPWQIKDGVNAPEGNVVYNYTTYPYVYIDRWNCSTNKVGSWVHYYLDILGNTLNWTQLVLALENVTGSYYVQLYQDLPWVDNTGPKNELLVVQSSIGAANKTYEFGVLNGNFTLHIAFSTTEDLVGLKLHVTQYNTTKIDIIPPEVVVPPIIPGYPLLITLGVSIIAVVIITYTIKKKKLRK